MNYKIFSLANAPEQGKEPVEAIREELISSTLGTAWTPPPHSATYYKSKAWVKLSLSNWTTTQNEAKECFSEYKNIQHLKM